MGWVCRRAAAYGRAGADAQVDVLHPLGRFQQDPVLAHTAYADSRKAHRLAELRTGDWLFSRKRIPGAMQGTRSTASLRKA